MKHRFTGGFVVAMMCIAAVVGGIAGCNKKKGGNSVPNRDPETRGTEYVRCIRVAGHQYLIYQENSYQGSICHREDCDHPIHKQQ